MTNVWTVMIIMGILSIHDTLSWEIRISPEYAVLKPGDVITISCQADVALAGCEFVTSWVDNPVTDLSSDLPVSEYKRGQQFKYSALEQGVEALRRGRCAVRFTAGETQMSHDMGCRGRTATGPWKYDFVSLVVDARKSFPLTITPRYPEYVLPGQELSVICKAEEPMEWCGFKFTGNTVTGWFYFENDASKPENETFKFTGAGLESGVCGIKYPMVALADSSWVECSASLRNGTYSHRITMIRVARPPLSGPSLVVPRDALDDGDVLTAECTAPESRPPANITWYLGDRVLDGVDDPGKKFLWLVSQGRKQTVTKRVVAEDDGKVLRCVVTHVAMDRSMEAERKISVGRIAVVEKEMSCPALFEPSVDLTCSRAGTVVPCSQPVPAGTVAYLKCKEAYIHLQHPGYRSITCTSSGVWSRKVFKCFPDCGKPNPVGGVGFISGGKVAKVGEFPWHVGVFKKSKGNNNLICGGTLISPSIVVSAAHCFWDNGHNRVESESNFLIGAGKFHRSWDAVEEDVQRRNVRHIFIHERFLGIVRNLASDIALVEVDEVITLTRHVNVVCMDWSGDLDDVHLVDGNNGTIAGWGVTENNAASDVLLSVQLPYVAFSRCKNIVTSSFLPFLTTDKICAGWKDRSTSVCPGDSGGGLVFPQATPAGNRFYLQGVVSAGQRPDKTGVKCNTQQVTSFTKIGFYRDWLEDLVFRQDNTSRK